MALLAMMFLKDCQKFFFFAKEWVCPNYQPLCLMWKGRGCRGFNKGGGGAIEPPKTVGRGWEKGLIDMRHSCMEKRYSLLFISPHYGDPEKAGGREPL